MHKPSGLGQTAYSIFPVTNYKFGAKPPKLEKDNATHERLARIKAKYDAEGMRRSVDAIILVAQHSHPHLLLLQVGQSHFFRLPGGKLKPDEDEVSGLKRKLDIYLAPESEMLKSPWDIGECVGSWVRPNFDTVFYPYTPPHITKPKEVKKLYVVQLPENTYFGVPKSYNLVAVPLFELYDNFTRYGPVIASIPIMLSRLRLNCVAPPPTGTTDLDLAALAGANQQQQQQQGALQLVKVDSSQAAAGQFGEEYEGIAGDHSRRASVVM